MTRERTAVDGPAAGLEVPEGPPHLARRARSFWSELRRGVAPPLQQAEREAAFARLDAWLADARRTNAVVVGPLGSGVSWTLGGWALDVAARGAASVVFVPVSRRLRTALERDTLALLAGGLQTYYGPAGSEARTLSMLRREIAAILQDGRGPAEAPRVVVLDGVEEAVDWRLDAVAALLHDLGSGVRAVVSLAADVGADLSGELALLGWPQETTSVIPLPSLDPGLLLPSPAVAGPSALEAAGVDVGAALRRAAGGDLVLGRIYAEALLEGELSAQELARVRPGLDGYLDRCCATHAVDSAAVRELLFLLSAALGPASCGEIARALHRSEDAVTSALRAVKRLLAGDVDGDGHALRHPRIAACLQGWIPPQDEAVWERRWVDACATAFASLQAGAPDPARPGRYAVEYYGAHLQRRRSGLAPLLTLVCPAWHEAWAAQEGAFLGFVTDVRRARAAAEQQLKSATAPAARVEAIRAEIRCALVEASLVEMHDRRPIGDGDARGHALIALAKELSATARDGVVAWAYEAARGASGDGRALLDIAALQRGAARETTAREAAAAFRRAGEERHAGFWMSLVSVAPLVPEPEGRALIREAVDRASSFAPDAEAKAWHLANLAAQLPEPLVDELTRCSAALDPADRRRLLDTLAARRADERTDAEGGPSEGSPEGSMAALLEDGDVEALGRVLRRAADLDMNEAVDGFCVLLDALMPTRTQLLHADSWIDLARLAPLIARIGGEEAVLAVAREIIAVAAWLP